MRTGLKIALLLPLFALMAPTGGFPSRPTFQNVVVNTTGQGVNLQNKTNTFASGTAQAYLAFTDSAARQAYFGWAGTPNEFDLANSLAAGVINFTGGNGNSSFKVGPTGSSATTTSGYALTVNSNAGTALSVVGTAGVSGLAELSGNAGTVGTNSLAVGQDSAGNGVLLQRGAKTLAIGNNGGGQISLTTTGVVQFVGNVQAPVIAFDASLQVAPVINTCLHCQASPTIVRNSVGNYTITAQSTGTYIWACTFRNNTAAPGTVGFNSTPVGGVQLLIFSTAGSLVDPSPNTIQCVGVS